MRAEQAIIDLLECPTSREEDYLVELGFVLRLYPVDTVALVKRAGCEVARYYQLMRRSRTKDNTRAYIRWTMILREADQSTKFHRIQRSLSQEGYRTR
jgi:hypothetical protein